MTRQVQFHLYPQSKALEVLLPLLKLHLPFSNPIYNRIQSPLNVPERHCLFAATFPLSTRTSASADQPPISEPFTILFADRSRHQESQIWLYNSLTKTYADETAQSKFHAFDSLTPEQQSILQAHVLSTVQFLKASEVPEAPGWPFHPNLRFACLHPFIYVPLTDLAKKRDAFPYMTSWNFWLAPTKAAANPALDPATDEIQPANPSGSGALPEGFTFARVREVDLDTVISTSSIPRQKSTLLQLPNVAIFKNPSPYPPASVSDFVSPNSEHELVAWAYIGIDGSLATLYVQPSYRNRGFAKSVAKELLRRLGDGDFRDLGFDGQGGWVHADVKVGNAGSEGVMKSVGAEVVWTTVYCWVDSEKF
ncbi:hypothetical protein F5884DRAFT_768498 [Xylogone sp. PMI_703]|nr:hypothetical protein F5884DRAFT_768498 [Xylogone sp. PMI_703]